MDAANIIESISLIIAAWAVIFGINAWRREYIGKRRLELAEEVLALFYEARDIIAYIRNPFSFAGEGSTRVVNQNETEEETRIYNNAYVVFERYNKRQELFNKISSLRYRYMAQFGKNTIQPFDDLSTIINEIFTAARMLPFYWKQRSYLSGRVEEQIQREQQEIRKLETKFWYQGESDSITQRVNAVILNIEEQCLKLISKPTMSQRITQLFRKFLGKITGWIF